MYVNRSNDETEVSLPGFVREEAEARMHDGGPFYADRRWTAIEASEKYPTLTYDQIDLFVAMIHGSGLGRTWIKDEIERHWNRELSRWE
jgi:hypothetical protein